LLVARFKEKAFDEGLSGAVAFVGDRFEQNLGPALNVVRDRAGFFSPQTVARTNDEIKEFNQRFKKDLIIETFALPPPDRRKQLEGASPDTRNKVFGDWLAERSRAAKSNGISVLIC